MSLVISLPGLFKEHGSGDLDFSETLFVEQESMPADLVEITVSSYEDANIDKIMCEKKKEIVK